MKLKNIDRMLGNVPDETSEHVKMTMDILDRIHELLQKHFGGKQKLLAQKMNKSEAEVSKMLNGYQNFTTKTLNKLAMAFGEPVIAVCSEATDSTFVQAKAYKHEHTEMVVSRAGNIQQIEKSFKAIERTTIKKQLAKLQATDNTVS